MERQIKGGRKAVPEDELTELREAAEGAGLPLTAARRPRGEPLLDPATAASWAPGEEAILTTTDPAVLTEMKALCRKGEGRGWRLVAISGAKDGRQARWTFCGDPRLIQLKAKPMPAPVNGFGSKARKTKTAPAAPAPVDADPVSLIGNAKAEEVVGATPQLPDDWYDY